MKTQRFFISALLGVVCLTACSVHEMDDDKPLAKAPKAGDVLTFNARIEGENPKTRTTAVASGNSFQHWWSPGDAINVFYGVSEGYGAEFGTDLEQASQTATFTGLLGAFSGVTEGGDALAQNEFWATYPFSENNSCDGSSVTVTMPAQQSAPAGSWDPASDLYVAKSKGLDLFFYLVGTSIRFSVTTDDIAKVEFKSYGPDPKPLAGTVRVAFDENHEPYVTAVVEGTSSNVISVTPKDGIHFVPNEVYFFNFLPGTLDHGFSVTYYNDDGVSKSIGSSNSKEFKRKEYQNMLGVDDGLSFDIPLNEIRYKTTDNQPLTWPSDSEFHTYVSTEGDNGWFILKISADDYVPYDDIVPTGLFTNKTTLKSVIVPASAAEIGVSAFEGCTSLTRVVCTGGDPCFDDRAFYGCTSMTSFDFPEGWSFKTDDPTTVFGGGTPLVCVSGEKTSSDGHAVVIKGEMVYFAGAGLTSYTIPSEVTKIGSKVFQNNTDLTSLVIPEGVTEIGASAMEGMTGLTKLTLPAGLTSIGSNAFRGCANLTEIRIEEADTPPTLYGDDQFDGSTCSIYVPLGTLADYKTQWSDYERRIFEIDNLYVIRYTTTDGVAISPTVTNGFGAGWGNADTYGEWKFHGPITAIPAGAFAGKTTLASIEIPDSVESIGTAENSHINPFYGCSGLTTFTGKFASADGKALISDGGVLLAVAPAGLDSYMVMEGITTIGGAAFRNCSIPTITLPSTLTKIEWQAFQNCGAYELTIPESVTEIEPIRTFSGSRLLSVRFLNPEPVMPYVITGRGNIFADTPSWAIIVPDGCQDVYQSSWSLFGSMIVPESAVLYYQTSDQEVVNVSPRAGEDLEDLGYSVVKTGYNPMKDQGLIAFNKPLRMVTSELFRKDVVSGYDPSNITSLTLPSQLTIINTGLSDLSGLTSLTIPESVNTIYKYAFKNCSNLTEFGGPLASADKRCIIRDNKVIAFLSNGLTSYTFPEGVEDIECSVGNDNLLESITCPEGVRIIGASFSESAHLTTIRFPKSLTNIGADVFRGCTALTSVTLPKNIRWIGMGAFWHCTGLQEIVLQGTTPPGVGDKALDGNNDDPNYPDDYESNCKIYVPTAFLKEYKDALPYYKDRIEGIGTEIVAKFESNYRFASNESFSSSNDARYLRDNSHIDGFTYDPDKNELTVTYASKVNSFDASLFYGFDSKIYKLTLPSEINTFGPAAFSGMSSLETIDSPYSPDQKGIVDETHTLVAVVPTVTDYHVPSSGRVAYAVGKEVFKELYGLTHVSLHSGVTSIGEYAFSKSGLTGTVDLSCVTELGEGAFSLCQSLKKVIFNNDLREFSKNVFSGCFSLESVTCSGIAGVEKIDDDAFSTCPSLKTLSGAILAVKPFYIGENAFRYCGSLTTIDLQYASHIGRGAFEACRNLSDIRGFSEELTRIEDRTFSGTALTEIDLPILVTFIGQRAFFDCRNLRQVNLSLNVSTVGDEAFAECSNLLTCTFAPWLNVLDLGRAAFKNCRSMTSIVFPPHIKKLSEEVFYGCSSLLTLTIPQVESIERYAFAFCSKLTDITIRGVETVIQGFAFGNCDQLKHLRLYGEAPQLIEYGGLLTVDSYYEIHVQKRYADSYYIHWDSVLHTRIVADL